MQISIRVFALFGSRFGRRRDVREIAWDLRFSFGKVELEIRNTKGKSMD